MTVLRTGIIIVMASILIVFSDESDEQFSESSPGKHPRFEFGDDKVRLQEGQRQFTAVQGYSDHPRYGHCWTNALQQINEGCRHLTVDEQGYLALAFANCHLDQLGFETCECLPGQTFKECTSAMTSRAYVAYTEFFTHTQNICFFLQNQIWHEQTEQTVSRLPESSEIVADQLEVAGKIQEQMIIRQNESLKNQEEIMKSGEHLRDTLDAQTEDIQGAFAEIKATAAEHKELFAEAFQKVADLKKPVITPSSKSPLNDNAYSDIRYCDSRKATLSPPSKFNSRTNDLIEILIDTVKDLRRENQELKQQMQGLETRIGSLELAIRVSGQSP